jgi:hypothetical protein
VVDQRLEHPRDEGLLPHGSFYDTSVFAIFFFQMVFMDTTATIPTGACAERWKFSSFVLYGCAIGTIMYPIYGNWVWGGGWCSQLGVKLGLGHGTCDFAGSSVVHLQGGVIAFWFAKMLGPRVGKYNKDGTPNVIPRTTSRWSCSGTFILRFGWFGFNPGGSLGGHGPAQRHERRQHDARVGDRRHGHDPLDVEGPRQQARPLHDVQRHARRPGGDHGPLRVRQLGERLLIGLVVGHPGRGSRLPSFGGSSRSTTPWAPSRSTAPTASGASFPSACSLMGRTGDGHDERCQRACVDRPLLRRCRSVRRSVHRRRGLHRLMSIASFVVYSRSSAP